MWQESVASSTRIAVVLMMFIGGRAFGGLTDTTSAAEIHASPALNEKSTAPIADASDATALGFDLNRPAVERHASDASSMIQRPSPMVTESEPAVTAPLPSALLPGIVMIACTFVATRVFKRKLI